MRALPVLALLLALPAPAAADSFVEVLGGIMIPVEDAEWTNYVESGPKLATHIGATGKNKIGGMLGIDWTPLNTDDMGFGDSVDISAHRFRIIGSVVTHQNLAANIKLSLRVGAGLDIARVNVVTNIGPFSGEATETDTGLGLEAAGGLWFQVGSMQVGGELALPLSFHADDADNDIDLDDYSSFDLDILFGVRFIGR